MIQLQPQGLRSNNIRQYASIYINGEIVNADGYNEGHQYSVGKDSVEIFGKILNEPISTSSDLTFSIQPFQLSQLSQLVRIVQDGPKTPFACSDTA